MKLWGLESKITVGKPRELGFFASLLLPRRSPMPAKSIYRGPGAKHFVVVHRSQRDPLAHDPDASPHVLKAVERENVARKGRSLADLEQELARDGPSSSKGPRDNLGEAVLYGVDYDDSEYDYMQHLREVGLKEDGVDSILIEAGSYTNTKQKRDKHAAPIALKGVPEDGLIPQEALPSKLELARDYERDIDASENIPLELQGLQPDMDPHLRQTLEALEDDAFVDGDLDGDDFFGALVADGERDSDEDPEFEFHEDGHDGKQRAVAEDDPEDQSFEARFRRYKLSGGAQGGSDEEEDGTDVRTERADTISGLPKLPVIGGKRRRKGASDASGYSLSSSSMFRNQGLTDLDERFDAIERQYEEGASDEEDDNDERIGSDSDDEAPNLIAAREDFDSLVDDFLGNYEIVGNKFKPVMPGDTPLEKLDSYRKGFDFDPKTVTSRRVARPVVERDALDLYQEPKKDRWDCETILCEISFLSTLLTC